MFISCGRFVYLLRYIWLKYFVLLFLSLRDVTSAINSGSSTKDNDTFMHKEGLVWHEHQCNIVYIKTPKVGSSTVGGIARRIAYHYHITGWNTEYVNEHSPGYTVEPMLLANHNEMWKEQRFSNRFRSPTFYFTWLRDPADRCLSEFYHFEVSRSHVANSDAKKVEHLKKCHNVQYAYIANSQFYGQQKPHNVTALYNFIGLNERFEESVLLLGLELNLTMCDLLYLNAKDSHNGGKDDVGAVFTPHPKLYEENSTIQAFVASDAFRQANTLDYALISAVNYQLDAKIQSYFSNRKNTFIPFGRLRQLFHGELQTAWEQCYPSIRGKLPSTTDCYWRDNGCGYSCLDEQCRLRPNVLNRPLRSLIQD